MTLRLADPGTLLSTTHEVDDGLRVRLRLARPSDAVLMEAFFDELSDETRAIRDFTFFNPRERLVMVAAAMAGHSEEIVGVADVVLLDTAVAELGAVVHDPRQGMGIGELLTEAIASLALRQGASHLRAELDGDQRMLALMRRLGPTMLTAEGETSVAVTRLPATRRRAA